MLRLLVFPLLFGLAYADDSTIVPSEGSKENGCPIKGNTDYYGIGVRVGIYSVWLTSWIANNFLPDEIIDSLETNSIFLLALFATVFFYSIQINEIRAVDVLVIHQLCTGFLFSVMSLWGYRTMYYRTEGPGGRRHFGGFGTHFRLVLMAMITAFGVWFWTIGLDGGLSDIDGRKPCGGLQAFFFTPVNVSNWGGRGPQVAIACLAVTYYGVMAIAAFAGAVAYVARRIRRKPAHWELIKQQDAQTDLTKRELTNWYIALSSFNLFWIVFSMISIEITLSLNHMRNVMTLQDAGPGQLIPLFIGVASLLRVLYILLRDKMGWRRQEDSSANADSPAPDIQYIGGLGLAMLNANSIYSPAIGDQFDSAGKMPSAKPESISCPPPFPATGAPRKRSLFHRFLLAWLPWLEIFDFWRQPITPSLPHYAKDKSHNRKADPEIGYESLRPKREERNRMSTTESLSAALLNTTPQLSPGQRGLEASTYGIEMTSRRLSYGQSDLDSYVGMRYDGYEY